MAAAFEDRQRTSATAIYTVARPSNRFTVSRIRTRANGTITFSVKVPGLGRIDVLETA